MLETMGWISILPVTIAIVLAFTTRNTIVSLATACIIGCFVAGKELFGFTDLIKVSLGKEGYNIYGERRTSTSSGRMFENVVLCGHDEICSQIKKAHKILSRFGIISWDFAVDENGEPILIEYNLNYPDVMIYQMNNGPLFGDLTQTVLEDVREKLKKER